MHILVTDHLGCPRCGPEFGLILMAHRLEERRVLEGHLGCANCREHYPVVGGFGDLRPPPRPPLPEGEPGGGTEDDPEGALRTAAFLGVTRGPGFLLLAGGPVRHATRLVGMIPEIEVLALSSRLREADEEPGVSRFVAGTPLPFRERSIRGVALGGEEGTVLLDDAIRVLVPGGRLVLQGGADSPERLLEGESRMEVALATPAVVVAVRK